MGYRRKQGLRIIFFCIVPILVAYCCRLTGLFKLPFYMPFAYARSGIYILMFTAFAVSIYRRIIQIQVRKYLITVACLMVLWIIIRTVRYMLANVAEESSFAVVQIMGVMHWMWYLYYLPLIFIPLLTLFVSLSICRSENFRISRKLKLLYIPACFLLLLVLTNDLHQLVFSFPPNSPLYFDKDYTYGIGYFAIFCWIVLCAVFAMISVFLQNRMPDKKRRILIPTGILALLLVYNTLNAMSVPFIVRWFSDFSVISCLCLAAFFESLFRLNLIQSNSRYGELFRGSSAGAVIMNNDYETITATNDYTPLSETILRAAVNTPVMLEGNICLSSAPLSGGRVFWTENVSELAQILEELEDKNEYLTEREKALEKELETKQKKYRLHERNRLYNEMTYQTQKEIKRYKLLIDELETASDPDRAKTLMVKLAIVCIHIKRRGNLIFLTDDENLINLSEAEHAINEWLSNLRLCGVCCTGVYSLDGYAPIELLLSLYETFADILYAVADCVTSLMVRAFTENGAPQLLVSVSCSQDIGEIVIPGVCVSNEGDREWVFTVNGGAVL